MTEIDPNTLGGFLTNIVDRIDNYSRTVPKLLESVKSELAALSQSNTDKFNRIEAILMAYQQEVDALGVKIDAGTTAANKVFDEVRVALGDIKKNTITQADLDTAVAAQQAKDEEGFKAAIANLSTKVDGLDAAVKKTDDLIPDAQVTTEPGTGTGTPTTAPTV